MKAAVDYVWCGPCGRGLLYAVPSGEFACSRCGSDIDADLDLWLDPGHTWGVDSDGRLYGRPAQDAQ
ncbi:hypothetical protein [Streptomyces vinaceus]|uniref:hypothetical protein n=1 Tax=Streptomyces vinaceus TaxID=1960 RepID=UPI003810349E